MSFSFFLLGFLVLPDLLWWGWAHRRLRGVRWGRWLLGLYMVGMLAQVTWILLFPSTARRSHLWLPVPYIASVYLWHLLILPVSGLLALGGGALRFDPTRRRFLLAVPPVATAALTVLALRRETDLRRRDLDLAIPGLPRDLDGLTIAHVSDVHVGKFTRPEALDDMVALVNGARADLVLLSGDLIDLSLVDLPRAADAVRRLVPRTAMQMCVGNHDLIDSREGFLEGARGQGLPLLVDEAETVRVRGRPVQLLGLDWRGDAARLRSLRDPEAFPILLAHHPHAWDELEDFPLVLSGHTHGGLLMLNEALGAGPLLYRYWSGPYRRERSTLVVSNGVGNWFPLRVHAPAEVLILTLRAVE